MTATMIWNVKPPAYVTINKFVENAYKPVLDYRFYFQETDGNTALEPANIGTAKNLAYELNGARHELRHYCRTNGIYQCHEVWLCNDTGAGPRDERHIVAKCEPKFLAENELQPLLELAYETVKKYESEPVPKPEPEITPHTICNEYNGDNDA